MNHIWIIATVLMNVFWALIAWWFYRIGLASGRQIQHAYRNREMRSLKGAFCWWDEKQQALCCSFPENTSPVVMEEFASRFKTWGNGGLGPEALTRALVQSDVEDFAAHRYERPCTDSPS